MKGLSKRQRNRDSDSRAWTRREIDKDTVKGLGNRDRDRYRD